MTDNQTPVKKKPAFRLEDLLTGQEEINYAALTASQDPRQQNIIYSATPRDWQDTFREWGAPLLHGITVGGLAATTGAITAPIGGGLPGATLGGMIGDQVYQTVQKTNSKLFGRAPQGVIPSIKSSAIQSLLNEGFIRGIPWTRRKIGDLLLKKFFPVNPLLPIQDGLDVMPGFKVTVPEYTQSKAAQTMLRLFVPEKELNTLYANKARQIGGQATKFLRESGAPVLESWQEISTPKVAKITQQSVTQAFEARKTFNDQLYHIAENVEIPKVQTPVLVKKTLPGTPATTGFAGKPAIPPRTMIVKEVIPGGTPVNSTQSFAKEIYQEIENKLDPVNDYGKDPKVKIGLERLRDRLSSYLDLPVTDVSPDLSPPRPIMAYSTIKENQEVLGQLLKDPDVTFLSREQAIIKNLRDLLSKDKKLAASGGELYDGTKVPPFWPTSAGRAYERATNYYAGRVRRYAEGTPGDLMLRAGKDPSLVEEEILDKALSTAQQATQLKKSMGTSIPLSTEFVYRGLNRSFDPGSQTWNGQKFIEYLFENQEVGKTILNREQRDALKYLGQRMTAVQPYKSEAGRIALFIRLAGAGIGLGTGTIQYARTGDPTNALLSGGIMWAGFEISRQTVRNLFLNPANTRLFSRYTNLDPSMPEAKSIFTKLAKGALRGTRFMIQFQGDTQPVPFEAREDGRLHKID